MYQLGNPIVQSIADPILFANHWNLEYDGGLTNTKDLVLVSRCR